jgi:hypothetical protein
MDLIFSGKMTIFLNMSTIKITWDQLNDVRTPAASPVAVYGLLETITNGIAEGDTVEFTDAFDNVVERLTNQMDLDAWKERNAAWLPQNDEVEDQDEE